MARTDAPARPVEVVPHERRELVAVMGCRGSVTVVGPDDPTTRTQMATVADWRLRELEERWSRFLPDSDISRLALAGGRPVEVAASTRRLVRHLVEAWEATGGAFDPTLLPVLLEHGYRASVLDPAQLTLLPADAAHGFDPALIEVDDDAGTVRLPAGGTLDAGGLGKGLAADLVVTELLDRGATGAMVEIGGDLRVAGEAPWGPAWLVDVEDPDASGPRSARRDPLAVVGLLDGGVATSSRLHRRWVHDDGRERHHLIDPVTGAPGDHGTGGDSVVAATVVTATGAWSEAFAKVPFVRGVDAAMPLLESESIAALVVLADGTTVTTERWTDVLA